MATTGPSAWQKRMAGCKRHILVDTGGLVLAAHVHGADLPDRDGGRRLLGEKRDLPRLELLWADGAYTGGFREWLQEGAFSELRAEGFLRKRGCLRERTLGKLY